MTFFFGAAVGWLPLCVHTTACSKYVFRPRRASPLFLSILCLFEFFFCAVVRPSLLSLDLALKRGPFFRAPAMVATVERCLFFLVGKREGRVAPARKEKQLLLRHQDTTKMDHNVLAVLENMVLCSCQNLGHAARAISVVFF